MGLYWYVHAYLVYNSKSSVQVPRLCDRERVYSRPTRPVGVWTLKSMYLIILGKIINLRSVNSSLFDNYRGIDFLCRYSFVQNDMPSWSSINAVFLLCTRVSANAICYYI